MRVMVGNNSSSTEQSALSEKSSLYAREDALNNTLNKRTVMTLVFK